MVFFFFQFSISWITDRFSYVEPSLLLWEETDLKMVSDFYNAFLDSGCQYFIQYFCINVHE